MPRNESKVPDLSDKPDADVVAFFEARTMKIDVRYHRFLSLRIQKITDRDTRERMERLFMKLQSE